MIASVRQMPRPTIYRWALVGYLKDKEAGCDKIFTDVTSGAKAARPDLKDAEMVLREGDALVVWKLDRLGRSSQHLIESVNVLKEKGVGFRSLQEAIDTQTSGGKLVFHIFSALAEKVRGNPVAQNQTGKESPGVCCATEILPEHRVFSSLNQRH
jgi:predicted site-specific integrase-resolvase